MGLPYGDLEVDTALLYDRPLLLAAIHRTGHSLPPWRVPLTPIVAPPGGRMAGVAVGDLPSDEHRAPGGHRCPRQPRPPPPR